MGIFDSIKGVFSGKKKETKQAEQKTQEQKDPATVKKEAIPNDPISDSDILEDATAASREQGVGHPSIRVERPSKRKIAKRAKKHTKKANVKRKAKGKAQKRKKTVEKKISKKKGKKYRKIIAGLKEEIRKLQDNVKMEKAEPKAAISNIKNIYKGIKSNTRDIDVEIKNLKSLSDFTEQSFLKRQIDEPTFRARMQDYREKLHLLSLHKKELMNSTDQLRDTKNEIPDAANLTLDEISRSKNIEDILARQTAVLEKLAGVQKDHKSEAKFLQKKLSSSDSEKLSAFIAQKAKGKIDDQKLTELEGKVNSMMEKYDIPETEIEARLGGGATSDVLESINKLVGLIELEKKTNEKLNEPQRIQTAVRVTEPIKQTEEVVGIATEIKKHRLITDFDKIVMYIAQRGRATFAEIAKDTGIPRSKIEECCNLLKDENQIEVVYRAIGDAFAQTLDYKERTELEKLKKKDKGVKK